LKNLQKYATGNVLDLADKIGLLVGDEGRRRQMAEAARTLAEKKYAWDKVADRILDEFSDSK